MKNQGKEILQRLLAVLVIVAMLTVMGIPPPVIFFFAIVTYFIWRAVRRTEQQEVYEIFNFYLSAAEVLRDDERRWFGFEIAEVIEQGEGVLRAMNDAPPLVYFTLGALYHRIGDHAAAAEHLAAVVEHERGEEFRRVKPSPELRRYVQTLRRLEREPSEGPQTLAAVRYLSRVRRHHAASLLAESRTAVESGNAAAPLIARADKGQRHLSADQSQFKNAAAPPSEAKSPTASPVTPPPIAELLRDLYEEEKKTA